MLSGTRGWGVVPRLGGTVFRCERSRKRRARDETAPHSVVNVSVTVGEARHHKRVSDFNKPVFGITETQSEHFA